MGQQTWQLGSLRPTTPHKCSGYEGPMVKGACGRSRSIAPVVYPAFWERIVVFDMPRGAESDATAAPRSTIAKLDGARQSQLLYSYQKRRKASVLVGELYNVETEAERKSETSLWCDRKSASRASLSSLSSQTH